jgi:putative hydrolase of the HAD superfamily
MAQSVTAFVFDFGRVLFDWQPERLLQRWLPQRAFDAASTAHWTAQVFQAYQGDWGEFDRGAVSPAELVQRIAQRTGLRPDELQSVVDAAPASLLPIPASVALMKRLRQPGRPMFYLSNMPAPFAVHLAREHAFVRAFDDGVFSSQVKLIKPDPEIFALAAQRFGLPPAELVFFDDVPANVAAAQAAGWQGMHFTDAAQCERDLRRAGLWPAENG